MPLRFLEAPEEAGKGQAAGGGGGGGAGAKKKKNFYLYFFFYTPPPPSPRLPRPRTIPDFLLFS